VSPTFSSLHIRNFRIYAAGGVVSNVGTWMQRVAQDWLVLQLTAGSGIALGITTGLQFLPMLLFGMVGGVIADRYPKRRVLAAANAFMGMVALTLGVLVLSGAVAVWHVYVLAFLLGLGAAVENPTRQSFVVEMVGRDDLPNAVGLNSASFNAARIVGPSVAGFLIYAFGDQTGPVFLLNALSYGAVILALRALRERELHPSPRVPRARGQLREGLRYVGGRPDLQLVLLLVFFAGTFGLNFQMTTALMATEVFGKGSGEYGLLGSLMAVGSLTGALLAARRGRPRLRLLVLAALVFGVLVVVSGVMPTYWTFAASLVPVGMAALTLITAANATMQLGVEETMRGRVMALYMVVFFGGTPLGAPLAGAVAEAFGARWSLILGGLVVVVATLASTAVLSHRRGVVVRAHLRPRPHFHVRGQGLASAAGG
jgi:MFS family permease